MRTLALLGVLLAAACVDVNETGGEATGARGEGYNIEIRAAGGEQVYLITTPEGRTVGARAADGASMLMDGGDIQSLAGTSVLAEDNRQETVSMRVPGFELSVRGNPDEPSAGGEGGSVSINIGGDRVVVDADEGAPGEEDDRAHVRISGLSEAEVRDFVAEADELSPSVQAQLLTELGLE